MACIFQNSRDKKTRGPELAPWFCAWTDVNGNKRSKSCGIGISGRERAQRIADEIKQQKLGGQIDAYLRVINEDSEQDRFEALKLKSCDVMKSQHLKSKYGLLATEYNAMLRKQGSACACCGSTEQGGKGGKFVVDHCHKTGMVRGLLCHKCNTGIGLLRDSVGGLVMAIEYLLEFKKEAQQCPA